MNRLPNLLIGWIACLAMLFGALAPALSHAVPKPPGMIDFPVCSAAGHTAADLGLIDGQPGINVDLAADPFKHCPFCGDGHHAVGLLPHTGAALVAVGGPVLPSLFYQAPEPLFHWAATRSRGPPIVS